MVQDYDRPLEIDFLLIVGVFMVILGLLLFEAGAGRVALNGDSIYGLSLVLVAFEAIAMGKTPFGDVRQSWLLLVVALCVATLGMFACFIPGTLTSVALRKILIHGARARYCGLSGIGRRSEPGWTSSMPALRKTSSWSPWPISWPASHGLCSPAEKTTNQTATWSQHHELARKRRLRLGSVHALPLYRTTATA